MKKNYLYTLEFLKGFTYDSDGFYTKEKISKKKLLEFLNEWIKTVNLSEITNKTIKFAIENEFNVKIYDSFEIIEDCGQINIDMNNIEVF